MRPAPDSGRDPRAPALAVVGVGVATGVLAGVVMMGTLVIAAATAGVPTAAQGVETTGWTPLNAITAFIFGLDTFGPGYRMASYAGLAIHLALAGLLGALGLAVIAALLGLRPSIAAASAFGLTYGLALQVLLLNLFVNAVQDVDTVYSSAPEWTWWLAHALYGVVLGSAGAAVLRRASVGVEALE